MIEAPQLKPSTRPVREPPIRLKAGYGIQDARTGAQLEPTSIPWIVRPAAIALITGYLLLLARLVMGLAKDTAELAALGVHTFGLVAILLAYFGLSAKIGALSSKNGTTHDKV